MPIPDLKPFDPVREQWLRSEVGRMADAVEQLSRVTGDDTAEVRTNAGGVQVDAPPAEEFWARINSLPGTNGEYAWFEVNPVVSGGVLSWLQNSSWRAGTTGANPAYEANGNVRLPRDPLPPIVRLRRAPGGQFYVFDYCCQNASLPVPVPARTVVRTKRSRRPQVIYIP